MNRVAAGLLTAFLATGCVHNESLGQVHPGMSPQQVSSIMGPPDATANQPGGECAYYTVLKEFMSRTPWSMSDRYYVCYTDGKVDTFGKAQQPDQAKGS